MSLNKQKIIPLIESYYHTFTPLERTIADFFMNNTEEEDLSSRHISGILYVSEASLSRFAQKCGFHGYREFIYEYKQSLIPETEENVPNFEISEFNTYQELLNKANALLDKAQIARITRSAGFQTTGVCLWKRQFRACGSGNETALYENRSEYRSNYRQPHYEGKLCYS